MIIRADLKVDLSNLPERIFLDLGCVSETVCRLHFLRHFRPQGIGRPGAYTYKQWQVYKVCEAPADQSCLACVSSENKQENSASSQFEPL